MAASFLIEPGQTHHLDGGGIVTIDAVKQRRWSRVGRGRVDGRAVFTKQFIDQTGKLHERGFLGELETARLLSTPKSLPSGISTIPILGSAADRALSVSPWVEMQTWDDLVGDGTKRRQHAITVGQALAAILLHRAGDASATSWKGLDPKNVGLRDRSGTQACSCLAVFDLGPPTSTGLEEAAARVAAFCLAAPLSRRPTSDVFLRQASAGRALLALLRPLTTENAVDQALQQLLVDRAKNGGRAGPIFTGVYRAYRLRALQAWRRAPADLGLDRQFDIKLCSQHDSTVPPQQHRHQGSI